MDDVEDGAEAASDQDAERRIEQEAAQDEVGDEGLEGGVHISGG